MILTGKARERVAKNFGLEDDESIGAHGKFAQFDSVDGDGHYWATVNTAAIDSDDEVVVPSGANPHYFEQAKSVYLNHNYDALPIGTMRHVKYKPKPDVWKMQFHVTNRTAPGKDTRVMIEEGAVRGTSVMFTTDDVGPPSEEEVAKYGPSRSIVRTWNWIETSVTPMPCNIEALFDPGSFDDETNKSLERLVGKGWIHRKTAEAMGWKPARKTIVLPRCETLILDD